LLHSGASSLSETELLAIVLRTGSASHNVLEVASQLLALFSRGDDDRTALARIAEASIQELQRQPGIGQAKAVELKAAFELGRRLLSLKPGDRPQVKSPQDVHALLRAEMEALEQEHLRIVLLNTKNRVQAVQDVYRGSINSAQVRIGELFREPIRQNCAAVIIVHNHPSGDPTPSPDDVQLTRQVAEAGQLLDIEVLDHLVIGRRGFVSLRERGLGFARQ
jgi:DNA repair protein RadC